MVEVSYCPTCKRQLLVNEKAGVAMCPDWRHWGSKPTFDVPEGKSPVEHETSALGQKLMTAIDGSFPFLRDAFVAQIDKEPFDLFAAVVYVVLDVVVQQFEGRTSGAMPEAVRRAWLKEQLEATASAVVEARVGKMPAPVSRVKTTVN